VLETLKTTKASPGSSCLSISKWNSNTACWPPATARSFGVSRARPSVPTNFAAPRYDRDTKLGAATSTEVMVRGRALLFVTVSFRSVDRYC